MQPLFGAVVEGRKLLTISCVGVSKVADAWFVIERSSVTRKLLYLARAKRTSARTIFCNTAEIFLGCSLGPL